MSSFYVQLPPAVATAVDTVDPDFNRYVRRTGLLWWMGLVVVAAAIASLGAGIGAALAAAGLAVAIITTGFVFAHWRHHTAVERDFRTPMIRRAARLTDAWNTLVPGLEAVVKAGGLGRPIPDADTLLSEARSVRMVVQHAVGVAQEVTLDQPRLGLAGNLAPVGWVPEEIQDPTLRIDALARGLAAIKPAVEPRGVVIPFPTSPAQPQDICTAPGDPGVGRRLGDDASSERGSDSG